MSDVALPPEPAARRGPRAGRIVGAALAVLFVLAAGSAAVALYALRGSPDSLSRMVPASSDIYVSVNLDPALGQKAALARLSAKFPSLKDPATVRKGVQDALEELLGSMSPGLSFHRDVEPWLGSQFAVIGRVGEGSGDLGVLVASKDDGAAEASLARIVQRSGSHWSTAVHAGITVHIGPGGGGAGAGAYALVDHAVVFGSSRAVVDSVIDTDQNTVPRLTDDASYATTVAALPAARLALVYVNYPSLVKTFHDSGLDPALFGSVSGGNVSLDAYRGMGIAVSAESAGLAVDVSIPLDRSKLSAKDLATLSAKRDARPLLAWAPARAFGVVAAPQSGLRSMLDAFDSTSDLPPSVGRMLHRLGITGPDGLEQHLTGDFAIEAGPGTSGPAGALLVGSDDEAAMGRTLDRLATLMANQFGRGFTSTSKGSQAVPATGGVSQTVLTSTKPTRLRWRTLTYRDVTIHYVAAGATDLGGLQPAYAVSGGMGIIASSPEQVQAVLDTKAGGPSVTSAPAFAQAIAHGGSTEGDVVYVDLASLVAMLSAEGSTPGDLRPLRTLVISDHFTPDAITERLFLTIG